MGLFGAAHGWKWAKKSPPPLKLWMMELGTVTSYLKKIQKSYQSRSSHQRCSVRKSVLRNFAKFTGKYLCQSLFFNKIADLRSATLFKKRLWHRCFPVNFVKSLRTPFLQNTSWRLVLSTTWHTPWVLQISVFFHQTSEIFDISRNKDIYCILIYESLKVVLIDKKVAIFMMSAKFATLGFLKSCKVKVMMWFKLYCRCGQSFVILAFVWEKLSYDNLNFYKNLTKKVNFLWDALGLSSRNSEILH